MFSHPRWTGRYDHLAYSTDGVHWEKPNLGIIPFNGSSENNIVGPPSPDANQQGASVFRDDHGPAEERSPTPQRSTTEERRAA